MSKKCVESDKHIYHIDREKSSIPFSEKVSSPSLMGRPLSLSHDVFPASSRSFSSPLFQVVNKTGLIAKEVPPPSRGILPPLGIRDIHSQGPLDPTVATADWLGIRHQPKSPSLHQKAALPLAKKPSQRRRGHALKKVKSQTSKSPRPLPSPSSSQKKKLRVGMGSFLLGILCLLLCGKLFYGDSPKLSIEPPQVLPIQEEIERAYEEVVEAWEKTYIPLEEETYDEEDPPQDHPRPTEGGNDAQSFDICEQEEVETSGEKGGSRDKERSSQGQPGTFEGSHGQGHSNQS